MALLMCSFMFTWPPAAWQATNRDVYEGSISHLVEGITNGMNGTVFAYGSTGSGKTHTMVGE